MTDKEKKHVDEDEPSRLGSKEMDTAGKALDALPDNHQKQPPIPGLGKGKTPKKSESLDAWNQKSEGEPPHSEKHHPGSGESGHDDNQLDGSGLHDSEESRKGVVGARGRESENKQKPHGLKGKLKAGTSNQLHDALPSTPDPEADTTGDKFTFDDGETNSEKSRRMRLEESSSTKSTKKKKEKKGKGEEKGDPDGNDDKPKEGEVESGGGTVKTVIKVAAVTASVIAVAPLLFFLAMIAGSVSSSGGAAAIITNSCDAVAKANKPGITNGNAFEYLDIGPLASNLTIGGLSDTQLRNAREIIREGQATGIPRKGVIVALATAAQESTFQNYANDGTDPRLGPDQKDVSRSMGLPHDAVGRDHGSVGVLQQQYPWWGTLEELMTPHVAAKKFYDRLKKVDRWENLPVTVAAQTVQQSLYPDAYAPHEPIANQLYDALSPGSPTPGKGGGSVDAAPAPNSGQLVPPMAAGTYQISSPYGQRGESMHYGQDFAGPLGTPIYAVANGVVTQSGPASGFGNWIVISSDVDGKKLDTVYGHMFPDGLLVKTGDNVTVGQHIANEGNDGESSGPHLHFEVHPGGWKQAGGVDPTPYLGAAVPAAGDRLAIGTSAPGTAPDSSAAAQMVASTTRSDPAQGTDVSWPTPKEAFKYINDSPIAPEIKVDNLSPAQMKNAREIILEGQSQRLPEKAILVALTTSYQESSGFKNYANSNVPKSISYDHDAIGSDHDSVGVLQQRVSNPDKWGTLEDMMTPHIAASNFYKKLMTIPGWEAMPVTVAAQSVQASAFPDAYAPYESKARQVLTMLGGGSPSMPNTGSSTVPGRCDPDDSPKNRAPGPGGEFQANGAFAQSVIDGARRWLGKPYQWGGGDQTGPTLGDGSGGSEPGFDCSGLILYAVSHASGSQINLSHYTQAQQDDPRAKVIPFDQKQPGDAIYFTSPGGGDSHHVGVYVGNNQLLHAPETGDVVKVSDLNGFSGEKMDVRRFG